MQTSKALRQAPLQTKPGRFKSFLQLRVFVGIFLLFCFLFLRGAGGGGGKEIGLFPAPVITTLPLSPKSWVESLPVSWPGGQDSGTQQFRAVCAAEQNQDAHFKGRGRKGLPLEHRGFSPSVTTKAHWNSLPRSPALGGCGLKSTSDISKKSHTRARK